jgi:hypothetical protein
MALTETTKVDQIELTERNVIQIRTATIIEKDGQELTRTYHRHLVEPGQNVSNEDSKVQAIANAIWTEEVIAEYEQYVASLTNGIN